MIRLLFQTACFLVLIGTRRHSFLVLYFLVLFGRVENNLFLFLASLFFASETVVYRLVIVARAFLLVLFVLLEVGRHIHRLVANEGLVEDVGGVLGGLRDLLLFIIVICSKCHLVPLPVLVHANDLLLLLYLLKIGSNLGLYSELCRALLARGLLILLRLSAVAVGLILHDERLIEHLLVLVFAA